MTESTITNVRYLVDRANFKGRVITSIYRIDGIDYAQFSGSLYNYGGPDLTLHEYLSSDLTKTLEDPAVLDDENIHTLMTQWIKETYFDQPAVAIDADEYDEMLNVLPPLKMGTHNGIRYFLMCEFTILNITRMYGERNGQFRYREVDVYDKSTWLKPEDFED